MVTFIEGALTLEFGEQWDIVVKWDDDAAYRTGIERLEGSKAVDVLALAHSSRELLMIEVKDFRGHRIENRERIRKGELFNEVGHKVRDTVAGVVGAAYRTGRPDMATLSARLAKPLPLTVVLLLEEEVRANVVPVDERYRKRRKSRLSVLTQRLKKQLRWLTPHAIVVSRQSECLADKGIQVRSTTEG